MTRIYIPSGLEIEYNQFYILTLDNNVSEIIIGEKIIERASKKDGDSNWVVDGPINETDLMRIIHSTAGIA